LTPADFDVLIVGAGAAGMMCAIEAGRRGRKVLVVDHARAPGEKIRISGGGRCNFTNLEGDRIERFLGENPRFAASALKRFGPRDFIDRVDRAGIAWHEKTLGQLFCDDSAKQIIRMLVDDMRDCGVTLKLNTQVSAIERGSDGWAASLGDGSSIKMSSVVVASGGKSIPKMGATGWGYDLARRFGLRVTDTRPALVPLTFEPGFLEQHAGLAGVALEATARTSRACFREALLFTHRGLSGPAILQISSYWREGEAVDLALAPDCRVFDQLKAAKQENGKQAIQTALGHILPRRLADAILAREGLEPRKLAEVPDRTLQALEDAINGWSVKPVGSEGYRTAEVTLGGVDTAELDQQTLQARSVPGLFFIGEVVDITGWLGGYNFQWAWSSGWVAGKAC
jgi:predicted Rossmann fold flavoprotein